MCPPTRVRSEAPFPAGWLLRDMVTADYCNRDALRFVTLDLGLKSPPQNLSFATSWGASSIAAPPPSGSGYPPLFCPICHLTTALLGWGIYGVVQRWVVKPEIWSMECGVQ